MTESATPAREALRPVSPRALAPDGRPAHRPIRKDTVVLDHMQTHVIEFTADNPGLRWFFHCHNIHHQHGGMATEVQYRT
ncbi:MAG TPA: multicopper oxidase domain-containing protein [Longimicrobiales bacterium]|nr:multicopper oxidase domain-containing protein [Longimicrobiales bacterium]